MGDLQHNEVNWVLYSLWTDEGNLMSMTLCGYPQDYDIVGDPQDNEVNGVPFWLSHFERPSYCDFQGTLTTITLWGHPHDYDIMRDTKDNDIDGGTLILWGYSHDYKIMVCPLLMVMTLWRALMTTRWWGTLKTMTLKGETLWP